MTIVGTELVDNDFSKLRWRLFNPLFDVFVLFRETIRPNKPEINTEKIGREMMRQWH